MSFGVRPGAWCRAIVLACALWAGLCVCGFAAGASAQNSPFLQRDNPLRTWLPSPEARAEREQAALEQQLEALLARQPGVEHAEALVRLSVTAEVPLEQPAPAGTATLVVRVHDARADSRGLTELARNVLPEGTEVRVTLVNAAPEPSPRRQPTPTASGRRVGPFLVESRSAGALRVTLAALLASNALLAGLLLGRRSRR